MSDVPANDVDLIVQLYTWLPMWQKLLRLQDWNITVNVKRRHQMSDHDVLGLCRRYPTRRTQTSTSFRYRIFRRTRKETTPTMN